MLAIKPTNVATIDRLVDSGSPLRNISLIAVKINKTIAIDRRTINDIPEATFPRKCKVVIKKDKVANMEIIVEILTFNGIVVPTNTKEIISAFKNAY